MYKIFILSFEYPPIYVKEGATLEGCQEPSCLEHYLKKVKEQNQIKNKNDKTTTIQIWLKKIKSYKNIKKIKKKE